MRELNLGELFQIFPTMFLNVFSLSLSLSLSPPSLSNVPGTSDTHTHTQELYENVKKEEFKVPDGEGGLAETFFNPEREGWLTKEGGKYKSKHRRWFILKEGMLYYFKQASVSQCCVFHTVAVISPVYNKGLGYSKD